MKINRLIHIIMTILLLAVVIFVYVWPQDYASGTVSQTITVPDGLGKGVPAIVPAHPKRVVFMNSSSLDLWLAAGGRDFVAGYVKTPTTPEEVYAKLAEETPILGTRGSVSAEAVVKQQPDLVVDNGTGGGRQQFAEALRQADIPVLALTNNCLADTFKELNLYGQMTGRPELAAAEEQRLRENIEKIITSHKGKAKPKVALIWGTPASFTLLAPNSRQGEFLELAGGRNIVAEGIGDSRYIPISLEFMAQQDPDYIFFITMGQKEKMQTAVANVLSQASSWNILRAVRSGNTHVLPPELFTAHYGTSIDKAIAYLNNILYP